MFSVFISMTFEDGFVYCIDKSVYDLDFDTDPLVSKHGNILHFHVIVES